MLLLLIVSASIDYEVHGFYKGIILLNVKWSNKVSLARKINNKGHTKIVIREISFLVEEEVNIAAGVILVFRELKCN